jgi:dihydroorotase
MNILIKHARIIDPSSPHNGQVLDIFIENGIITRISPLIKDKADREIRQEGLHVSPGWMDIFADFADPGYEFKETLETGAAAAAAGGFTDVMVIPNTNPCIHNKANVEYIRQKSGSLAVSIHPIGAVTKNAEGKELAEMYDMRASGAIAFSDGIHCIQSAGLFLKALQYVKSFGGTLIQLPDDKSINPHGLMNEGIVSTRLGLPGKPAMAEELMVARDIKLVRYAESKLHFTGVSSQKSFEYIKRGKESGAAVTCSVAPGHLFFCDEDLSEYDTNLKLTPPVRTKENREVLKKLVLDGTVDCIASHHLPQEYDSKVLEFEYARPGMLGLETAYAVLNTSVPGISVEKCVELLALNPRKIFGLSVPVIREGEKAVLTLFNPATKWNVTQKDIYSKSRNSPFIGKELTGKAAGIINEDKIVIH